MTIYVHVIYIYSRTENFEVGFPGVIVDARPSLRLAPVDTRIRPFKRRMQISKTITEQFEELIKKAKELNRTHPVIPLSEAERDKGRDSISAKPEISMLQKRHEMCVVQKNAIKDLIKLHNEELQLLESALRTIESEEKKILEIILREAQDADPLARATSVEMVERDNDSVLAGSAATTFEGLDSEALVSYPGSSHEDLECLSGEYSYKDEPGAGEPDGDSDDYSGEEESSSRHEDGRRRVRFSMEDLGVASETQSSRAPRPSSDYVASTARPSGSFKGTISISQRYNYIRNRNSSLMKEISIKKILEGNRKLDLEEKDQDQRALVRRLHSLYSSKR